MDTDSPALSQNSIARLLRLVANLWPAEVRPRMLLTLSLGVVSALFEVAGVASIMPFMTVLLDPTTIDRFASVSHLFQRLGAQSAGERTIILGVVTAATLVVGNAVAALSLLAQHRFSASTKTRVASKLFDAYLGQPYSLHANRDSASLATVALYDTEAVSRLLLAGFQIIARFVVVLLLLALLLWQDPAVAMWTALVLGGSYSLVYKLIRRKQASLGIELSASQADRYRIASEALGGIKDLLVLGREQSSSDRFRESSRRVADVQRSNALTAFSPRFLLESIAYCGVIATALALVVTHGGGSRALPTLALFAFAGYRLLPSLQQLFASAVELRFASGTIQTLVSDWNNMVTQSAPAPWRDPTDPQPAAEQTPPKIVVRDLTFRYPGTNRDALSSLNFSVDGGQSIGLVGRTGSGKSTLSDILLGLQIPDHGSVMFGSEMLVSTNVRRWRSGIGYVSQHIFLSNATIAANIAFGLEPDRICMAKIEHAAKMAQATEFIERLPNGFESLVGERGVKLSGGQRQRIGIARALYMQPGVLIFDEATSALDSVTEDAVMRSILALGGARTLVLIAHRLRTVQACDHIIMLDAGRIVAEGAYTELLESSSAFRMLALAGDAEV